MRVGQDFLLDDNGAPVLMDVFDRIFNGDDFAAPLAVDQINHVIEGSGLSSSGGAGDEEEPVRPAGQFIDFRGQPQFFTSSDPLSAKAKAEFGVAVSAIEGGADPSDRWVTQRNAQLPFL